MPPTDGQLSAKVAASVRHERHLAATRKLCLPDDWIPDFSDPAYPISDAFLKAFPGLLACNTVTRNALTQLGRTVGPDSSDEDLRSFVQLVNAWGFGDAGYGPWRTHKVVQNDKFADSARRALELLRSDEEDAPVEAYFHLNNRSRGRLPWWGPAFFTKFLAFADPASGSDTEYSRPAALILDRWMAVAVRAVSGRDGFPTAGWTTPEYAYYLAVMSRLGDLSELQSASSPSDVERALFAHYWGQ